MQNCAKLALSLPPPAASPLSPSSYTALFLSPCSFLGKKGEERRVFVFYPAIEAPSLPFPLWPNPRPRQQSKIEQTRDDEEGITGGKGGGGGPSVRSDYTIPAVPRSWTRMIFFVFPLSTPTTHAAVPRVS